jgi:hypothetical protein
VLQEKCPPKFKKKIVHMKYDKDKHKFKIKKYPLLLSKLIFHLIEYYKPKEFYMTGIDFYSSKDPKKYYLPGYEVTRKNKSEDIATSGGRHDLESNKQFFRYVLSKYVWINCDLSIKAILGMNI